MLKKIIINNNFLIPDIIVYNKTLFILLLLFWFNFIIYGCTSSGFALKNSYQTSYESKLVWPPPPQTPRIEFIGSVYGPGDLGIKNSWFKQIVNRLVGTKNVDNYIVRPYGVFADMNRIYVSDPGSMLVHVFQLKNKSKRF